MQVTCGECGSRCSVPERVPGDANRLEVCSLCGADLRASRPDPPRGQLDTLRLDESSLATLVRLGETTHAAAASEASKAPRAPQLSIPFELARRRTSPSAEPSLSFEFENEKPAPLAALPRPSPSPSLIELRRESERDNWEKTFAARVRKKQWGLIVVVLLVVGAVVAFALVSSGRVHPMRLLEWVRVRVLR